MTDMLLAATQDLVDDDGSSWPVTLSMSSSGVAKRMFLLEKIGTLTWVQRTLVLPSPCLWENLLGCANIIGREKV